MSKRLKNRTGRKSEKSKCDVLLPFSWGTKFKKRGVMVFFSVLLKL